MQSTVIKKTEELAWLGSKEIHSEFDHTDECYMHKLYKVQENERYNFLRLFDTNRSPKLQENTEF